MTHFISLDEVQDLVPIEWGGERVSAQYERLRARLDQESPGSAGLLAEPVWAGAEAAGAVSWYTAHEGEPIPFSSLPPEEQGRAASAIRQAVEDLLPLLRDRTFGPLLGRCLLVPDLEDVLLVGGRPVLRNWGWVLAEFGAGSAGLQSAWRAGLGRFLPNWHPWEMADAAEAPPSTPAQAQAPRRPWWSRPAYALPAMLLLVLGSALGSYAVSRHRFTPLDSTGLAEQALISRRQPLLEERVAAFTAALGAELCSADGADTAALDDLSAARLLQRATGRLIVPGMPDPARGTAFFVSKDEMVTTQAALEGVGNRPIFVESLGLGGTFRAERSAAPARAGLALLHLPAPARFAIPLLLSLERIPGTMAYAGALPGFVNPRDASFIALRKADVEESPVALVSRAPLGEAPNAVPAALASALPPGGDGGPVIDACGRVIGVAVRSAPAGMAPIAPAAELLRAPKAPACLAVPTFVSAEGGQK